MRIRPATRAAGWLLMFLFTLQTTGCHSWKVMPQPWPAAAGEKAPDHYRITRSDGRRFEAAMVKISGDTLYAIGRQAQPAGPGQGSWVGTPLTEVSRLEERHAAPGKTIALVGGIVLVVVGLTMLAMAETVVAIPAIVSDR